MSARIQTNVQSIMRDPNLRFLKVLKLKKNEEIKLQNVKQKIRELLSINPLPLSIIFERWEELENNIEANLELLEGIIHIYQTELVYFLQRPNLQSYYESFIDEVNKKWRTINITTTNVQYMFVDTQEHLNYQLTEVLREESEKLKNLERMIRQHAEKELREFSLRLMRNPLWFRTGTPHDVLLNNPAFSSALLGNAEKIVTGDPHTHAKRILKKSMRRSKLYSLFKKTKKRKTPPTSDKSSSRSHTKSSSPKRKRTK